MPGNDPTKNDPLGDLLGSLLGGDQAIQGQTQNPGDPLDQFLGNISGNANTASSGSPGGGSLGEILGGLMGGAQQGGMQGGAPGGGAPGANASLAPIIDAIAEKIGIPPQIATTIVTFALSQLMSGQGNQLAQMLGGRGTVSREYLRDSGLADQLTQQTGMDNETAVKSLQQVFQAFGSQMGGGTQDSH